MKTRTRNVTGLKKSWERAKLLHKKSKNQSSMPSLARSFLSTHPTDAEIKTKMVREYNEYLANMGTTTTPTRSKKATAPVDDVTMLFSIKEFLTKNNLTVKQMKKHLQFIEQIQA